LASSIAGGAGGVGSNGDFNAGGEPGSYSFWMNGNAIPSKGGSSIYGGGGENASAAAGAGTNAQNYGSGGSGGQAGATTDRAGGNGSGGLIIVWEFS